MNLLIDSPRYDKGVIAGYFLKKCDENKQHSGKYYTVAQYNALCEVQEVKPEVQMVTTEEQAIAEPVKRGRGRK